MKKLAYIFIIGLILTGCSSVLNVTSSSKQNIIPGQPKVARKTEFIFSLINNSSHPAKVDKVIVKVNEKFYKLRFDIMDVDKKSTMAEIPAKGKAVVMAYFQEGRSEEVTIDNKSDGQAIIKFTINNKTSELVVKDVKKLEDRRQR